MPSEAPVPTHFAATGVCPWVVFRLDVAADGPPFSYVSGLTFDPGAHVNRRNRS